VGEEGSEEMGCVRVVGGVCEEMGCVRVVGGVCEEMGVR
jgi:hypothetical protein